ncbi:hypothetical protein [Desulfovibrio sp. UCD-KL4C]|uniref:hypothetical protein n=1 Tax=Desulfovibrio sp. UCD-KL4C TaxID=2578120 RepID=UPI0025C60E10|nr:hypothetical protein [Desulfovibrio sp. UCD-KL4C]
MDISAINSGDFTISAATEKQLFGAQVVTKTLDYLNSSQTSSSTNSDYDFQKSVLGAYFAGKGAIANVKT